MSDIFKEILQQASQKNELKERLGSAIQEAQKLKEMESEIHKTYITNKFNELQQRKSDIEASENFSIDNLATEEYYESLRKSNIKYFEDIQQSAIFLGNEFSQKVPYFSNNLILVGAQSGNGKSTISANLALSTILQGKNVLTITNEEVVSDCYNRVTCLQKGWFYVDHKKFTKEQVDYFNTQYPVLGNNMKVIADYHNGRSGLTTTIEGIVSIMEKVLQSKFKFDAILIDYFQNISHSNNYPSLEEWKVLDKMAQYLDNYRKIYPAPIVLFSQLKPAQEDDTTPFKERIERCKSIYNKATCAIEVVADPENKATIFKIHKSRFTEGIGKEIKMGFDRGRYVSYDADFLNKINNIAEIKKKNELLKGVFGE